MPLWDGGKDGRHHYGNGYRTAPEKSAVDAVKGISRNQLIGILESALEISEQQGGRA